MNKNINLNLYRIFYEVANYKSFSEAAKRMYLSQPAVSKAVKNLEEELGVVLFYRTLNGVIITDKGKELYAIVEEGLNSFREAEKKMEESKNMEKGSLAIGIRSNVASFYLMDKVVKFHECYPNIDITIINRPSYELLKLLDENVIDFIIDSLSPRDELDGFNVTNLITFDHCFVKSNKINSLNDDKVYSLKDLKDEQLILPVPLSSHRQYLDEILKESGVVFTNVLSIETSELIKNMTKKGLGIGYILKPMVELELKNGTLKEVKIKEKLPTLKIKLIYKEKALTEAPRRFIDEYINKKD